jgi:hypothetical protein
MQPKPKWLLGVWIVSAVGATMGWWAGLALIATWLIKRAIS